MTWLKNERIALRAPEPEDLEIFYRWENDTELWKYGATVAPYSRYLLKRYLASAEHDIYRTDQLRLMIDYLPAGATAGVIDLYDFEPRHGRAGVGILIDREFRRQGIAAAALGLLADYAFSFLHIHQLFAYIPVSNLSSLELFRKNGFRDAGVLKEWLHADDGYADVRILQRIAGDGGQAAKSI